MVKLVKLHEKLNSDKSQWDLCTIGSLVMDSLYLSEHLPIIGGEVRADHYAEYHGGASGNVAAYTAFTFGLHTVVLANVGQDAAGVSLLGQLRQFGVNTSFVVQQQSSGRITLVTDKRGQRIFIVYLPERKPSPVREDVIGASRAVYIAPCEPELVESAIAVAQEHRKPVFFNPGSAFYGDNELLVLPHLIRQVDVLFLNRDEAMHYSNKKLPQAVANHYLELGVGVVVITDAENGSMVFTQENFFHQPAYRVDVLDPLGPGDSYASGFIAAILKGRDLDFAAIQGSKMGAFVVTQYGVREIVPSSERLQSFLANLNCHEYPHQDFRVAWPMSQSPINPSALSN